jgi:hypothetical protein
MKEVTLSLAITISKLESDKLVLNKRIAELKEVLRNFLPMDEDGNGEFKYNDGSEHLGEEVLDALRLKGGAE